MKKSIFILSAMLLCITASNSLFAQAGTTSSGSLTGYDIIKKADEVPEPKTSSSTATITIHPWT